MTTPNWKAPKGTFRRERAKRQSRANTAERRNKDEAKRLDGYTCRWPWCPGGRYQAHAAHIEHKGSGGDVKTLRSTVDKLITFCARCHEIFDKVGGRDVEPLTPAGTRGPCRFQQRSRRTDEVERWADESAVGVIGEQRWYR